MKMKMAAVCTIVAAMGVGSVALAGPQATAGQLHFTVNSKTLLPTLEQSYAILSRADHDYHGHRILAMKEIAAAALALGKDLSGDGKGEEPQKLSDLQIRQVEMALLGVGRDAPPGAKHEEIVEHINGAIEQLRIALETETDPKAEPKPGGKPGDAVGSNSTEIGALTRIYQVLALADHDYKGHRVAAMRAIARATKALGGTLSGDGKAGETQVASDQQLREAEALLGQVQSLFAGSDPKKVLGDLTDAVKELTTALSIK